MPNSTLTVLSPERRKVVSATVFLRVYGTGMSPEWFHMNKKTAVLATEEDLFVDLTFHNVPASLLSEFAEKIVRPYYQGNINAAVQDLFHKALSEEEFVLSHITHVRS